MNDMELILAKITARREQKKISRTQMGEMLGLTQDGYYKIETGQNGMDVEYLLKICAILDMSVDETIRPALAQVSPSLNRIAMEIADLGISVDDVLPYIESLLDTYRRRKFAEDNRHK